MKFFVLVLIILADLLYAQESNLFNKIKAEFINFQYKELIKDADELLKNGPDYDSSTVIEVYRMKAVSHFSLMQDKEAENSFRKILELDTAFSLDPYQNSPKIIQFFSDLKLTYISGLKKIEEEKILIKPDTVYITKEVQVPIRQESANPKIIRSLILPGWGHLYSGEKTKGWFLASLGSLSFLSSLYFTIDASSKEKLYSNETNLNRINTRYNDFNTSYKIRNISLLTFAAVWIYSQLDILFLSVDTSPNGNNINFKFSL